MEKNIKEVKNTEEVKNDEDNTKDNTKNNSEIKRGKGRPKGTKGIKYDNIVIGRIERTGEAGSGKYVGPDKIAMKKKLTFKQKAFVDEYLQSHNQAAAYRAAKGTLANPEEWIASDRTNGMLMRRLDKVKSYLQEKIMSDAAECLDIQMDMIRNEETPANVRNAAIIDRLNRLGLGKQKEESSEFQGIGEVTITIKHKQPDVIDMTESDKQVVVLDNEEKDTDAKTIQSGLGDDGEASGSTRSIDGQKD